MADFEEGWQAYLANKGLSEEELSFDSGEFTEHLDAYSASIDQERAQRQGIEPQDQREREIDRAQQQKESVLGELNSLEAERPAGWNLARPEHWEWEGNRRVVAARLRVADVALRRAEHGSPFADLTDEQLVELKDAKLLKREEIQSEIPAGNDPGVSLRIKKLRKDVEALGEEASQVDAELYLRGEERGEQALVEFQIQRQRDEEEALRETRKASDALEEAREKVARLKSMPGARRELAIAELDLQDAQTHSREVYEKHGGKLPMNYGLTYMAPV